MLLVSITNHFFFWKKSSVTSLYILIVPVIEAYALEWISNIYGADSYGITKIDSELSFQKKKLFVIYLLFITNNYRKKVIVICNNNSFVIVINNSKITITSHAYLASCLATTVNFLTLFVKNNFFPVTACSHIRVSPRLVTVKILHNVLQMFTALKQY